MLIAGLLSLVAAAVLLGGFLFSSRTRRPKLFRSGAALTSAGLILLWALPYWLFRTDRAEWAMPMFIGVMFVAVSVLGLGLQLMARASGAREPTHNDQMFEDFVRHNDLP